MMKIIKGASFPFLLSTLFVTTALAQGSYTAASCNRSDVNAVINGPTHTAVDGDIIIIPSGTCTWTSGITVTAGIDITGQGVPNVGPSTVGAGTSTTTIIDNTSSSLITVTGLTYGKTINVELLNLQAMITSTNSPLWFAGTCSASGCPNVRVDNITFPDGWVGTITQHSLTMLNNFFGVYDHNSLNQTTEGLAFVQVNHGSWGGVGLWGDNSFASADTFGTSQALYIENNQLNHASGTETDVGTSGAGDIGGARYVCRYNTFYGMPGAGACSGHGTGWIGRERGQRQVEVYRNSFTTLAANDSGDGLNSGTGLYFENNLTGYLNQFVALDVPRDWFSAAPWNYCDGSQVWDTNDGTTYASGTVTTAGTATFSDSGKSWTTNQWAGSAVTNGTPYSIHDVTGNFGSSILSNTATQYTVNNRGTDFTFSVSDSYQILRSTVCMDQTTRSGGTLYSGNPTVSPNSAANQTLDPVYQWGDMQVSGGAAVVISHSPHLIANRDWYSETHNQAAQTSATSPFNGTSGNGHGILAFRPTTCTPYVGYWATDQGGWNQSGSGNQGELFVCTSTNTWTLYYKPYTYPHPLAAAPAAPKNLQAVPH